MDLNPNRLWVDGCFDFTHHGHSGAILQARRLIPRDQTGELICGVHNDKDILINKGGMPVMNERERYAHTRSNRWCTRVVENAPYVTQAAVLDACGCKYVVHGDDISNDADGNDCYGPMKQLGRFRVVKRTEGVSTTDIIHRILSGSRTYTDVDAEIEDVHLDQLARYATATNGHDPWCYVFMHDFDHVTVKGRFAFDPRKTVYIEGDFDLFHVGHIEQLARLRQRHNADDTRVADGVADDGSVHVIVGITCSEDDLPCIMTLAERALGVLSCRYVDGIVLAPVAGLATSIRCLEHWRLDDPQLTLDGQFSYLNRRVVLDRVLSQRDHYVARNARKGVAS
ncbi:LAMI_0D05468g1_1 [Lachancea mirantina]|uniref:ethanolamine-phosphate cytidylyltransferase n=1 Tax=Lachancea mirantina TaxID=1230905 RepID=A0A1G4JBP9_9SACH|nr:LAMI_0D05468g1_1 [Lachancea mirantina]